MFNHTDSQYTVDFALFRTDGTQSRSAAREYSEQLAVGPQATARREAVAEARPYVVRYDVWENNSTPTDKDHVHFVPTGDGDDSVAFDIHAEGTLERR
ncbi:hypothetical protein [Haloarcula regularis]|uniref:hypothetical protein n=1 Tax=Haloarcula regularis TaxID=3033392 RepID=UPI0023E7DDAE|nr:hypothetical protein [Halomicroarcula sp. SYNS111]